MFYPASQRRISAMAAAEVVEALQALSASHIIVSAVPLPVRTPFRRSLLKSQHRGQSAAQQPSRAAPPVPIANSYHRQRRPNAVPSQPAEEPASRPDCRSRAFMNSAVRANRQFISSSAPFPPRPNTVPSQPAEEPTSRPKRRSTALKNSPVRANRHSHHRQPRSPPFFERHSSQPAEETASRPKRRSCQSPIIPHRFLFM